MIGDGGPEPSRWVPARILRRGWLILDHSMWRRVLGDVEDDQAAAGGPVVAIHIEGRPMPLCVRADAHLLARPLDPDSDGRIPTQRTP